MSRYILIVFLLLTLGSAALPVYATDFPLLELLISCHKNQSNRLRTRHQLGSTISSAAILESEMTDSYQDTVRAASKRMGDLMSIAAFAAEVVELEKLTEQVVDMEGKAIDLSFECAANHPDLVNQGLMIHQRFFNMTEAIVGQTVYIVTAGLNTTMATQEQRMAFTDFIREQLVSMRRVLANFLTFAYSTNAAGKYVPETSNDFRKKHLKVYEEILGISYETALERIKSNVKLRL